MNLDELRSVQNTERQKDSLQHLRESFYGDVAAYVEDLEERRDRKAEAAEDPFASPEVRRLTDEIETAKDVTQAIYERRLGKIVKRASLAAADMPADDDALTAEERELFSDLVDRIEANKTRVLDVVEGDAPGPGDADPSGPPVVDRQVPPDERAGATEAAGGAPGPGEDGETSAGDATARTAADAMGAGGSEPAAPASIGASETESGARDAAGDRPDPAAGDADRAAGDQPAGAAAADGTDSVADGSEGVDGLSDRTTVRITRDVGEIFGVDEREYDLSTEEVVTLPEENAEPLLQRGAAERLD